MKSKFVSAVKPTDYAEQLYAVQKRMEEIEIELKALKVKEENLSSYLYRYAKGESFQFVSGKFLKVVKIGDHSRSIMDQKKVKLMLKTRTPYVTSSWQSVKVDFLYE